MGDNDDTVMISEVIARIDGEVVPLQRLLQRDAQLKINRPTDINYSLLRDGMQGEIVVSGIDANAIYKIMFKVELEALLKQSKHWERYEYLCEDCTSNKVAVKIAKDIVLMSLIEDVEENVTRLINEYFVIPAERDEVVKLIRGVAAWI